jgi:hypothetical protein
LRQFKSEILYIITLVLLIASYQGINDINTDISHDCWYFDDSNRRRFIESRKTRFKNVLLPTVTDYSSNADYSVQNNEPAGLAFLN